MIRGLVILLGLQGAGELIARFGGVPVPGPVIGMLLLLGALVLRGNIPEPVATSAGVLTAHLGLLFVPAAVGVVIFWPQLKANAGVIALALVASSVATLAVSALILKALSPKERK